MGLTGIPGILLGSQWSVRLPDGVLRQALATVLLLSGVKLLAPMEAAAGIAVAAGVALAALYLWACEPAHISQDAPSSGDHGSNDSPS